MYLRDMGPYSIVLINLKTNQLFILDTYIKRDVAEGYRKNWRKILGGKHWTVERRDGLDTIDHIGLRVMSKGEIDMFTKDSEVQRGS